MLPSPGSTTGCCWMPAAPDPTTNALRIVSARRRYGGIRKGAARKHRQSDYREPSRRGCLPVAGADAEPLRKFALRLLRRTHGGAARPPFRREGACREPSEESPGCGRRRRDRLARRRRDTACSGRYGGGGRGPRLRGRVPEQPARKSGLPQAPLRGALPSGPGFGGARGLQAIPLHQGLARDAGALEQRQVHQRTASARTRTRKVPGNPDVCLRWHRPAGGRDCRHRDCAEEDQGRANPAEPDQGEHG